MRQSWEVCIANELSFFFYSVRAKAISNLLASDSKGMRAESCLVQTAPFRRQHPSYTLLSSSPVCSLIIGGQKEKEGEREREELIKTQLVRKGRDM